MRVGAYSYIGGTREENQDRYLTLPSLWAVADGMGGYTGGAEAADAAIKAVSDYAFDPNNPRGSLRQAMLKANEEVYALSTSATGSAQNMGTTLTVGYLVDKTLYIGHVGDSRIYLLTDTQILQLTQDHSFVGQLVRDGAISPDEALKHPNRNILTRAVGISPDLEVDLIAHEVSFADTLIFCTDGVSGVLPDADLKEIVESTDDPQMAAQTLCHESERRGGTDNATAIVVSLLPPANQEYNQLEASIDSLLDKEISLI